MDSPRWRLVKLVRDGVGEFFGEGLVEYRSAHTDDTPKLLRAKLIEEAAEYVEDRSIEELADLFEVVLALAEQCHGGWTELSSVRSAKYGERGGFRDGLAMFVSTTAGPSTWDRQDGRA